MRIVRPLLVAVVLVSAACSATPTLGEYAEDLEALVVEQNARLDQLDAELSGASDLDDVQTYATERIAARRALVAGLEALTPPDSVIDLHREAIDILQGVTDAEAVLADKVEDAESFLSVADLWDTPEGVAARTADQRAILLCEAAQDTFDRTQAGAEYEDVPWIPAELKEVVDVAFGCRAEDRR